MGATASAVPAKLTAYADAAATSDVRIAEAAAPLGAALDALRSSNSEGIGSVPAFDAQLAALARAGVELAIWVGRVGTAFQRADCASNPNAVATVDVEALDAMLRTMEDEPLTPAEEAVLAKLYAPILYFHPDEMNGLADPHDFIRSSSLRHEKDAWFDDEVFGRGDVPADAMPGLPDRNWFLDPDNAESFRRGDTPNAPIYWEYDAETRRINYWFFYNYNDGPSIQNHEGDWEQVTVQLGPDMKPEAVRYSSHGSGTERPWRDAPTEHGRPVVYVSQGSHANYPEPGTWATHFPTARDHASTGGPREDLAGHDLRPIRDQPWYGGGGGWGEHGNSGDTTGPSGPSDDKGPMGPAPDMDPVNSSPTPSGGRFDLPDLPNIVPRPPRIP